MGKYHVFDEIDGIIDQLVQKKLISKDRLDIVREAQKEKTEFSLCEIILEAGFVKPDDLIQFVGSYLDVPVIDPFQKNIDPQVIQCLPAYLARQYQLIPFEKVKGRLRVIMADPRDEAALTELQATYPDEMEICLGVDEKITEAIAHYYTIKDLRHPCPAAVTVVNYQNFEKELKTQEDRIDEIVNIVNNLVVLALEEKASDIHFDPMPAGIMVRFRVDGALQEWETLDRSYLLPIVSRIKVIAELDISERRVPQDGRARIKVGHRTVDLRVATYPTMWGEKVSIRILTKDVYTNFNALGLSQEDQETFENIINQPHGLFLNTGPTGSGKTTTLYSAFMRINRMDKNVISIEDPIENEIVGVNQAQVNARAGVTFASALRSMLRHDPDIILVGEIRDTETADTTARAAMTGHLVFSTLHTNSAIGAVTRLIDLGLEPYLIASSLIGIMGQRLVRKICPRCKENYEPDDAERDLVSRGTACRAPTRFYRGRGCENCRQTGFIGRTGLYEVIAIDEDLRHAISESQSEKNILERARQKGFTTIWEDGLKKVDQGITSLSEVIRVCRADEQ